MAQKKKSSSNTYKRKASGKKNAGRAAQESFNDELINEIILIIVIALALLLFLCNFGILGTFGALVSDFFFGLFGLPQYILPLVAGYLTFFSVANPGSSKAARRIISIIMILILIGIVDQLLANIPQPDGLYNLREIFAFSKAEHRGGGVVAGSLCYLSVKYLGVVGTIILIVVLLLICIVVLTERSFFKGVSGVSERSREAISRGADDWNRDHERRILRREESRRLKEERLNERRLEREARLDERRLEREARETEAFLNPKERTKSPIYNLVSEEETHKQRDDIHEINLKDFDEEYIDDEEVVHASQIKIHGVDLDEPADGIADVYVASPDDVDAPAPIRRSTGRSKSAAASDSIWAKEGHAPQNGGRTFGTTSGTASEMAPTNTSARKPRAKKPYKLPPVELLVKGAQGKAGDRNELMNTARKLERVLESFNVKAKVTEVSQGPSVTRYEMTPETGVKVSRILSLADDIKLNLAAADIRIEAPIPGKAAIGIEVPNKESAAVALRDLIESKEFKASGSKLSFAVGKDIAGKVVVTDIAKMPHMLIAGATGSGKSVCINTLIMSILYKATPEEVKIIMIDPKVVELSVYNGIPHLLIPVVTDPRKANASLAWAVKEMDDRYQKFAEWGVRDIKGYNEKIKGEKDVNGDQLPSMYQLVVIVDELADLMMVAGKEVEESICRLAQLARAAGIHLIIATQRPSVDVITGLIKANMPSRIAFSVSSGVDSRTILDMVGAEKLLGKGDMLFYPQGYTKPARVQGAFVSDTEVSDVVAFLKDSGEEASHDIDRINDEISSMSAAKTGTVIDNTASVDSDYDEFFYEAGKLITESGKSSIGMLQRKFKIGFNRAARIMDALSEAGVVGPEEGTKPRQILMSPEEFEELMGTIN